ncbi:transcriptional regulator, BadM/Rrf2 family [Mariprofundus ferrinatatus]|jgi:Rrf2 family iron-sulfur cluster assembly transcriptional regulator|uniref:Transcriptional regulator, BadM/Rrf2 family n=1 Tax=Mariprofundus ferrinatatus TaxID=1921087 RepID=A0A2K8L5P6_9PROT|nr:Rrf2 family transcriptional regulator [Mariprofundus ferrinatatus]ATX81171.1 transcriptional regulator, BadM/Rrf2 family [Mariprofundus ferrinatatus]
MRLTSKGRYAVSAMVDLNKQQAGGPVTLAAISERQFISLSYLEQLFRRLRESGLVRSVRGPGGGYLLAKDPDDISIADIIRAVNEPVRTTMCENGVRGCHRGNRCDTHQLWESLGQHIYRFLDAVSLEQVCSENVLLDNVELGDVRNYIPQPETHETKVNIASIS